MTSHPEGATPPDDLTHYMRAVSRLREALWEIEDSEPDWSKGVDENCEELRSIARAALAAPRKEVSP